MFRDSMPPVLAAASELSAMQNSILLLCDQVQELRGKLNASRSRPSSSQKSKLDELTRAKRELARVREENEALAMRCRQLSMMQSPQKLSDVQQVRRASHRVLVTERAFQPGYSRAFSLGLAGGRLAGSEGGSAAAERHAADRRHRQRAPPSRCARVQRVGHQAAH